MVMAYDPYDQSDRSGDKVEERISLNETRARCIALLRRELGATFTGGFAPNAYARRQYPDLIVGENSASQGHFIGALRDFPICVATTGLHGSAGWKLAEYVATSKAIVSEKLQYALPGDFAPDRNFLQFESPEECVERCVALVRDRSLRGTLMENNASYYRAYVAPDALVRNALDSALGSRPHGAEQRAAGDGGGALA
jgi:hypothetical protein